MSHLLSLVAMRHNLRNSRCEHLGSGIGSYYESVIWLWNQMHVVEKTYGLKGVEPEPVCEKFFQSPGTLQL